MILKRLWLSIVWAIIIMLLTGLPGNYFPDVVSFWEWLSPDKVVHLVIFGIQAFLMLIAQKQYLSRKSRFRITTAIIIVSIAFAALTEILQTYLFIRRCGSVYDFLADVVGVFVGLLAYNLLVKKKLAN